MAQLVGVHDSPTSEGGRHDPQPRLRFSKAGYALHLDVTGQSASHGFRQQRPVSEPKRELFLSHGVNVHDVSESDEARRLQRGAGGEA